MSDSANDDDIKLSLKVMINKEKTKVLFAEADNEFADVLLSFLTLPLGRIAKLLEKHYGDNSPVFGSITSLYKGLVNLYDLHFSSTSAKMMLLNPPSVLDSSCRNLKLDITDSQPTKYYTCAVAFLCKYHAFENMTMYYGGTATCACGKPLEKQVAFVDDSERTPVFTMKSASFIICDDLRMLTYSTGFTSTLSNLGINDADGAELRNVIFGKDEMMDLLKCSLLSNTPLTDFILHKGEIITPSTKPAFGYFLYHQIQEKESNDLDQKVIILKVVVQKSTNTLLFAVAEDDFIELLFSFLIIPIGGVASLLDSNTCLKNLDNLHRSISDVNFDKHFFSLDMKKALVNPNVPLFYKSKNMFLPLNEESATPFYFSYQPSITLSLKRRHDSSAVPYFKSPIGEGNFVKNSTSYIVRDDLIVKPYCMSSGFSILNQMNVSLSDVDELEVHVGLHEALSILKASLTSNTALTDGLKNRMSKKQPKQEHN